jgi:hypothetical protein
VTDGNHPRGRNVVITSASVTPASATNCPVVLSKPSILSKWRISMVFRRLTALSP